MAQLKYKTRDKLVAEIKLLREICKDLVTMPKGVESHSYSDYKVQVERESEKGYNL